MIEFESNGGAPNGEAVSDAFLGWQDENGKLMTDENGKSLAPCDFLSLTVTPLWKEIKIVLTLDAMGGELEDNTVAVWKGDLFEKLPVPTRLEYAFVGWSTSREEELLITEGDVIELESDTTLYAVWKKENSVNIIFNGGEGSVGYMQTLTVKDSASVTVPINCFIKDGFNFAGWHISSSYAPIEYSGKIFNPGDVVENLSYVDGDTVYIYPQWKAITYTVRFLFNDGTDGYYDAEKTYGEYVRVPIADINASREGYTLRGYRIGEAKYVVGDVGVVFFYEDYATVQGEIVELEPIWQYNYKGEGSQASPYQIDGKEALEGLSEFIEINKYEDKYFILTEDIDLNGGEFNAVASFKGSFDGNGKTVSNYKAGGGFFGENSGTVRDLNLKSVEVTAGGGNRDLGVLVNYNNYGSIEGCSVTASRIEFTGAGALYGGSSEVGLLVGCSLGMFYDSLSTYKYDRAITDCYAEGSIKVSHDKDYVYVGGLIGQANNNELYSCYADVDIEVKANDPACVGGLIGSVNSVYGGTDVMVSVTDCFAVGNLTVKDCVGKVNVGRITSMALDASSSSVYASSSSTLTAAASHTIVTGDCAVVEEALLKSESWRAENMYGFCAGPWANADGAFPAFGDRAETDSIALISTKEELLALSGKVLYGRYMLTADVDVTGEEWMPAVLLGEFDGNGKKITGLTFTRPTDGVMALFKKNYGALKSLWIKDINVNWSGYSTVSVAGAVSVNLGVIKYVKVSGRMTASTGAGSVIMGGIANLQVKGGIIGCYTDLICDAAATTEAKTAGILNDMSGGELTYCYSLGEQNTDTPQHVMYGIGPTVKHGFSLCNFTYTNKGAIYRGTVDEGKYSLMGRYDCFTATTQKINGAVVKYADDEMILAERMVTLSFQKDYLYFGQFVSTEDLKENRQNCWKLAEGSLPALYFE